MPAGERKEGGRRTGIAIESLMFWYDVRKYNHINTHITQLQYISNEESMEEEKKEMQPVIGEYQGKPIIRIPTVDNPNPETTWHWLSFGKNKAKAIVKHYDAIKKFAEE